MSKIDKYLFWLGSLTNTLARQKIEQGPFLEVLEAPLSSYQSGNRCLAFQLFLNNKKFIMKESFYAREPKLRDY